MDAIDKPVEEGKEYEVTIDAKGGRGDGIAHVEGFVIFVPGVQVGEVLKIRIKTMKSTFAVGERV